MAEGWQISYSAAVDERDVQGTLIVSRGELRCSALPVALPFYLTELRKVGA